MTASFVLKFRFDIPLFRGISSLYSIVIIMSASSVLKFRFDIPLFRGISSLYSIVIIMTASFVLKFRFDIPLFRGISPLYEADVMSNPMSMTLFPVIGFLPSRMAYHSRILFESVKIEKILHKLLSQERCGNKLVVFIQYRNVIRKR
jgi:hypothetical protein